MPEDSSKNNSIVFITYILKNQGNYNCGNEILFITIRIYLNIMTFIIRLYVFIIDLHLKA